MSIVVAIPVAAVLIVLYFVYDRRYRGKSLSGLRATREVFRDPSTGKRMRVYEDPSTGAREYVSEDD